MLKALLLAFLLLPGLGASARQAVPAAEDPVLEARTLAIASQLRCPVCQNQTIAESDAELAKDLRGQVRDQLRQGRSEAEIVAYMTARYGDFILWRPPFKGKTLALWLGPLLLVGGGIAALFYRLARERAPGAPEPSQAEDTSLAIDAESHQGAAPRVPRRPSRVAAAAIGSAVVLVAVSLYLFVGDPAAIGRNLAQGVAHGAGPADMEALVARLAERMERDPGNAEGWVLLGRSYRVLGRHDDGARAYAKAAALVPGDADVLTGYAHLLSLAQGGGLQGKPAELIARALAVDPDHLDALALSGIAALEAGDATRAIAQWETALGLVEKDSELARALRERIARARGRAGASNGPRPPGALGDLPLLHASDGREALEEINRLHGKDLGAIAGYVAHYEKDGTVAMIYLARAASDDQAARQVERMRATIQRGDTPFSELRTVNEKGRKLYSALGEGRRHFFYRQGADVLWLAADAPAAGQALAALVSRPKD